MESPVAWLHPTLAFALPIVASIPIGRWMARSLDVPEDREGKGLDAIPMLLCRLIGRKSPARMGWKRYAFTMLGFNAALFAVSFGLLYAQHLLPLNPDGKGSLGAMGYKDSSGVQHDGADTAVVFNTVCSFVTNTNLQHYSGEQHLSLFQPARRRSSGSMFVTPAAGLCGDAGHAPRAARRPGSGRLLRRPDART